MKNKGFIGVIFLLVCSARVSANLKGKFNEIELNKQTFLFDNKALILAQIEDSIRFDDTLSYNSGVNYPLEAEDVSICIGGAEPHFPGDFDALSIYIHTWIMDHQLVYEDSTHNQKVVYVCFIINEEGCAEEVSIPKGGYYSLNLEIIRMIFEMPRWEVGLSNGKKYRTSYTLPITFLLN